MSTSVDRQTLVVMAYARLKGTRENVPTNSQIAPETLVNDFNLALDDLKRAGYDLSSFQIHPVHMVRPMGGPLRTESAVLRARIDAVLIYFQVEPDKARIGFNAPKP